MVFKPKFFLDLGGADDQKPAVVAPVKEQVEAAEPAAEINGAAQGNGIAQAKTATATNPVNGMAAAPAEAPMTSLTTAEAMAVELAAAQVNRPAPSKATFAPECVTAGGAAPMNRRTGGANLAGFKEMAKGMMRS